VTLPGGRVVKARELAGREGLLFRRNSVSGALEVRPRAGGAGRPWSGLNADLHANA
jgi:2,3,4,5-tetrahydropyridine-2,6-dicarboxylate N-succinyltransferase